MPRALWKGAIAFGMVSIPVKLYTATSPKDVSFHLLHRNCGSRLKELRWCPVHEREITPDEIARGFEYAKDKFVVLDETDLEHLPIPSKHIIALDAFVRAAEIDPVYYQKSYFVEPDQLGTKPYLLLTRALQQKAVTALARVTLRTRERLCALRPMGDTLVLDTLFYADEIRVPEETPRVDVSERELDMAFSFIDLLSRQFEPREYQDSYRLALQGLVEAKLQGKELLEAPAAAAPKVVDLMAALKASVEAAKKRKEGEERETRKGGKERARGEARKAG